MIEKIDKLKTEGELNNYLIIQFSAESNVNEATKIRVIAHQRVRWETFKKHEVFQCYNCQRFGHASKNCNLNYRCVKCTEDYPRGHCKIITGQEGHHPTCVNCQGRHPANYRGCDYIKEAQEERNNAARRILEKRLSINKINNTTNLNTTNTIDKKNLSQYPKLTTNSQINTSNPESLKNSEITELKNLVNSFQVQVTQGFQQQFNHFENFKTEVISKVDSNSNKIDFLFNQFNLQWPLKN